MKDIISRFIRYAKIDTMSEEGYDTTPSTEKQFNLARLLIDELREMGAEDVYLDEKLCYVYARIPSNISRKVPCIGFVAHMDTSCAVSGENVNPIITENYDGNDIKLGSSGLVLSPSAFPKLLDYKGKTIISTDGTTLLGGDDKAGIAIIMELAKYITEHKDFQHGDISICFTPDEEVGMGVSGFDYKIFAADFAYTLDGEEIGTCDYECFNAANAGVTINGVSMHPGYSKGKMKNATRIAMEFDSLLPKAESPEYTELYEGFYHITGIQSHCEKAEMSYIIRDHSAEKFDEKKALFLSAAEFINKKYGPNTAVVDMKDCYRNMKEIIEKNFHLVDNAKKAYEMCGVALLPPYPVRGGTDGATLSRNGLPCPNLGTGDANCHGRYEYVCADDMETMVTVCRNILELYAK